MTPKHSNSKPLGRKAYGSIPHLPGSRTGPADHTIAYGQARILIREARDRHDRILITEKLDGSNVAIARINNQLIPLIRAGYHAKTSPYRQHQLFAEWVSTRSWPPNFLQERQRICGEWLAQAHGTRYRNITDDTVFIPFDLITGTMRHTHDELTAVAAQAGLTTAKLLHHGPPLKLSSALELLGTHGHHGAIDEAEGIVYRVERHGAVDFLAKYVRPGKTDGKYFPQFTNKPELWNFQPTQEAELLPG